MRDERPTVIALAGPNGAGKSTAGPRLLRETLGVTKFVNADVIAQGLAAFEPERVAVAAGRLMLARLRELGRQRATFAFETTLAGRGDRVEELHDEATWGRLEATYGGRRPGS